MKKIITTLILLSLSTIANAEYMVNYGEVQNLRFVTPSSPEIPEPEPEPVKECQYQWLNTGWMEYPETSPGMNIKTEVKWDAKLVANVIGQVDSMKKTDTVTLKMESLKIDLLDVMVDQAVVTL